VFGTSTDCCLRKTSMVGDWAPARQDACRPDLEPLGRPNAPSGRRMSVDSYIEATMQATGVLAFTTPSAKASIIWTCVGSVDCFRLRTVSGKEKIATNKPGVPTGVSPRIYPTG
jgi:hypothetical protein